MDDRPLAIELFAGMFGWGEGLVSAGWRVIGVDILHEPYHGKVPDGCSLVLQDVCTLHGAQFKDADLIVGSPPCQEFSYRAMPWKRAKALPPPLLGTNLFWQCWRIQEEAREAAGRYIPLVVENVKGAQPWIGRAKGRYGSFFLWGDVENVGGRLVRSGPVEFGMASVRPLSRVAKLPAHINEAIRNGHSPARWTNPAEHYFGPIPHNTESGHGQNPDGRKQPGNGSARMWKDREIPHLRPGGGNSSARKAASAQIAKIPFPLSSFIGRVFYPSK